MYKYSNCHQISYNNKETDSNCSIEGLLYEFDSKDQNYKFYGSFNSFIGENINESLNFSLETILDLIHPEDRNSVEESILTACRNKINYKIKYRIKTKNGTSFQIEDSAYISTDVSQENVRLIGTLKKVKVPCVYIKDEENLKAELINSSIKEAVIQIDNSGKIVYWNNAAQTVFGYYKEEIINETFLKLLPSVYHEEFKNIFASLLNTGKGDIIDKYIDIEAVKKDNHMIPIELQISPVLINGNWNAVAVVRDISERKLKERIVSETISFEKLVSSISSRFIGNINFDHVVYFTLRDIGIERNVDRVYFFLFDKDLKQFENAYEWSKEGIESHINYYNRTPISKYPWVMQRFKNGVYLEVNNVNELPDDANNLKQDLIRNRIKCTITCPILSNDVLIGFIGFDIEKNKRKWNFNDRSLLQFCSQVIANAIERKNTEDKLKESERRFRNLFTTAPLMILLLDFKGVIVDVNKKVIDTLNLEKREIIGRNILELNLIRKEKLVLFQEKLKDLLKNEYITPVDIPVLSDDFKLNWVRLYASLISVDKKSLIQVILQDISEKKRTELELIDSEKKYRGIFDGAMDAIFLLDKAKIVDANRMAIKMYGYSSKSDFIGISPWELSPKYQENGKKSKELALEYIERALSGEPLNFTWKHIQKNGTLFDAEISLNRQRHGKKIFLQAIVRDISEKLKSAEQLKQSKKQFQSIIESIGDALHVIDRKYILSYSNQTMTEWLESYSIDSNIIGRDVREVFHFLPKKIIKEYEQVFKTGKALITVEETNLERSKIYTETRKIPLISKGKANSIVTIIRDITIEKKAEFVLKESEKKFRTLFESSKDGIVLLDSKGDIIESNQAFRDMINYPFEESHLLTASQVFKGNPFYSENAELKNELEANGYVEEYESELSTKDGSLLPVSIVLWTLEEDPKGISRIWAIIRDISERKKSIRLQEKFKESLEKEVVLRTIELNEALKKQKLYLDHIAKTSHFKTEFMASMSHELRTPLNAIIGFTDLLSEGCYGDLNKSQLEFITDIQDSSYHLLDMITRILDISKIESGELSINIESFNLYNLVEQVLSTFKALTQKKNIEIIHNISDKKKIISADRIKLKQILYNLIGNAVKFTLEGKILLKLTEDNDYWRFTVKDTGIGIAKEDYDEIFKDFKRVKSAFVESVPGSGLGLALTKRIVNLHGGVITFESELGVGSSFIFKIPKKYQEKSGSDPVHDFLRSL